MDYEGDIVMGDFPLGPEVPQLPIEPGLANYTLTFGKFKGKTLSEVPTWYLKWLPNITDPSPTFTAALAYALAASSFTEMEIDWSPPPISAAPDRFHQWRKLKEGYQKSGDTALWISNSDTREYFSLSDEILQVMKVVSLPNDTSFQQKATSVARYALYHVWDLAHVYMTKGEVDFVLRKYINERLRGIGQGSPRKREGSGSY